MNPVVIHITGCSGTGKTTSLETFRDANPGSIQLLTPTRTDDVFNARTVDWDSHAAVALDELLMWEPASGVEAIPALERDAEKSGKQLILVTQCPDDLAHAGIQLSSEPFRIDLGGRRQSIDISYDGSSLHFSATQSR